LEKQKNNTERLAALQRSAFVVDAHFDLTYEVANRRERGRRKVIAEDYLSEFKAGSVDLLVSAIFIHNYFLPEMGLRRALDQISHLLEEMEETPGLFRICRNVREARAAREAGELGLMLSLEGADPLQNDLGLLRIFHQLGVRALGLVWSRRNYAGDGCSFKSVREGRKGGLTAFGVDLVEKAELLGMLIDVSHINDEGFWDVMEVAQQPVIASHSNCRALAGSMRNLTDDQIEALAKKGGVIGMNAQSAFIRDGAGPIGVEQLADHVDHIVKIAGVDHVGVGLDLCDSFSNHLNLDRGIDSVDVLNSHHEMEHFTAALINRGYSDDDIRLILGGNFLRVFEEILQ
jgi:membrane dipeptidase